MLGAAQV